jgi:hypothetical protein
MQTGNINFHAKKIPTAAPTNRKTQPIFVSVCAAGAEIQSEDTVQ